MLRNTFLGPTDCRRDLCAPEILVLREGGEWVLPFTLRYTMPQQQLTAEQPV